MCTPRPAMALPLVEHDAADELDPEMTHPQHPVRRLPADGEGLRQQLLQRLPGGVARLEFLRFGPQLTVGEPLHRLLESLRLFHQRHELFDLTVASCSKQLGDQSHCSIPFAKICHMAIWIFIVFMSVHDIIAYFDFKIKKNCDQPPYLQNVHISPPPILYNFHHSTENAF